MLARVHCILCFKGSPIHSLLLPMFLKHQAYVVARHIRKNVKCVAVAKYMKTKTTINAVASIIFRRQHKNVVRAQLYEIYISRVLVLVSIKDTNRLGFTRNVKGEGPTFVV